MPGFTLNQLRNQEVKKIESPLKAKKDLLGFYFFAGFMLFFYKDLRFRMSYGFWERKN